MPEKLVRDRIPDIIARKGDSAQFRRAEPTERFHLLCEKLVEEARELQAAPTVSKRFEEIGDVLEVIYALIKSPEFDGIRPFELDGIRESKAATHGTFTEGWVLIMDTPSELPTTTSSQEA